MAGVKEKTSPSWKNASYFEWLRHGTYELVYAGGQHHVCIHTSAVPQNTTPHTTTIQKVGECFGVPCNMLVCCVGYKANDVLYSELARGDMPVHNISDSNKVRNIMAAIWEDYELGSNL